MEDPSIAIRLLEARIAHAQYCLAHDSPDQDFIDGAHLLILIIERQIANLKRIYIEKREGTLEDLGQLKVGVRLCDVLLDRLLEQCHEELKGWRWGQCSNSTQYFYDFVYDTGIKLGWSIAEIEGRYPEYKDWFDAERESYRLECEQQSTSLVN